MAEMLEKVKLSLGITGEFLDATLSSYIDEVKAFMRDAGVDENIINSDVSVGVISRGVSDLWNYGSGGTDFSPYFYKRVTQLVYTSGVYS